jgi:hypothetical protein
MNISCLAHTIGREPTGAPFTLTLPQLPTFGHLIGHSSLARSQRCSFCEPATRNTSTHSLGDRLNIPSIPYVYRTPPVWHKPGMGHMRPPGGVHAWGPRCWIIFPGRTCSGWKRVCLARRKLCEGGGCMAVGRSCRATTCLPSERAYIHLLLPQYIAEVVTLVKFYTTGHVSAAFWWLSFTLFSFLVYAFLFLVYRFFRYFNACVSGFSFVMTRHSAAQAKVAVRVWSRCL